MIFKAGEKDRKKWVTRREKTELTVTDLFQFLFKISFKISFLLFEYFPIFLF